MASLRASLLTQRSASSCTRSGMSPVGGGLKGACSSVPAACRNLERMIKLSKTGRTPDIQKRCRGTTGSGSSKTKTLHNRRPGSSRNSFFALDLASTVVRPDLAAAVVQFRHYQQQSLSRNDLIVAVIRPPLETSPDVKPSLNPFAPSIPDPNLPAPPTTTNPPDEPPSEFPTPATNPEPEVVPSVPLEVPATDPVPEFSPTMVPSPEIPTTPSEFPSVPTGSPVPVFPTEVPLVAPAEIPVTPKPTELPTPGGPPEFTRIVGVVGVPRGPPIIPPSSPPIVPPGTPQPIPPPNLPPVPPPGTPPPIPPPQTPPIPPGMPGPVPPPTPPPSSRPPFPSPEIPGNPNLPPSIIGAQIAPLA